MTDYISRDDALNFELEVEADPEEIQAITKGMALYGEYIKSIPAAAIIGRVRGEWIVKSAGKTEYFQQEQYREITCSVCKNHVAWPTNYCPNCGAWMEVRASDG